MSVALAHAPNGPRKHLPASVYGRREIRVERYLELVEIAEAAEWDASGSAWDASRGARALPGVTMAARPFATPHTPGEPGWRHRAGTPFPTGAFLAMRDTTRHLWR